MIDLKQLRDDPDRFRKGARDKNYDPAVVDQLLAADTELRAVMTRQQELTAEKNRIGKQIGQLAGQMKKAAGEQKAQFQQQMQQLQQRPNQIKQEEENLIAQVRQLEEQRNALWLKVPQPADPDVPVGSGAQDNVEIRRWNPRKFDTAKSFAEQRGFEPKTHIELMTRLGMVDFDRGVKMAGSRSYVLTGDGMRLHQAILRCAFDFMTLENGFRPMSAPVLVRDELMVGTGFFPEGREQSYAIANPTSEGAGFSLAGTGEVGLMGLHMDEMLAPEDLPLCYTTLSPCFRREAGAAGKDTAGLFRIHYFEKVEQVVICRADEAESRAWHQKMMSFVETLLQKLELPYRLLQCCSGDLGPKNVDMVDIECWMPGRGEDGQGAYCETHSASRLYDYQCRRLNIRYKDPDTGKPVTCHSLNNTVAASPRILIPLIEMYQNADGTITIPATLRPYMGGAEKIG
ncbi:MAG: serine--tRNA ligase [Phycisphaeraceae bacterium]|nr:serine--tRNA ligase [Phycisphaeraceae bacterium]